MGATAIFAVLLVAGIILFCTTNQLVSYQLSPNPISEVSTTTQLIAQSSTNPKTKSSSAQNASPMYSSVATGDASTSMPNRGSGDASNGFEFSSSINYQNFTYKIYYLDAACDPNPDSTNCDAALVQINPATLQATTLVPSLWQAIPALRREYAGQVDLLFADSGRLFMHAYSNNQNGDDLGYYQFDLAGNKSTNLRMLSYHPGNSSDPSPALVT